MSGVQNSCTLKNKLEGVDEKEKLKYIEELHLIYERIIRSIDHSQEDNSEECPHCTTNHLEKTKM